MIRQINTTNEMLILQADFPSHTPEQLFDYWVKPDLLAKWWPPESEIDATVGGSYHLIWPPMDWHLRGIYHAVERGKVLAFSWHWDHEPDKQETQIMLVFHAEGGGSTLTVSHGRYADDERGQEERKSHLDGWLHFLGELQKTV